MIPVPLSCVIKLRFRFRYSKKLRFLLFRFRNTVASLPVIGSSEHGTRCTLEGTWLDWSLECPLCVYYFWTVSTHRKYAGHFAGMHVCLLCLPYREGMWSRAHGFAWHGISLFLFTVSRMFFCYISNGEFEKTQHFVKAKFFKF